MIKKPHNFSVLELFLVEVAEIALHVLHLFRNIANWKLGIWPVSRSKNFWVEFTTHQLVGTSFFSILFHKILWICNILHHSFDLIDSIMATFHLQLLNEQLLSFIRHTRLIKQPGRQQIGITGNKSISPVQTTEESDDRIKSDFNLWLTKLFQTSFEFIVTVKRNVMRRFTAIVHELLECSVSSFLKLHVVTKGIFDQAVHFFFELQELGSKFDRIVEESLVVD